MKKAKLISLVMVLAIVVSLVSSCSGFGGNGDAAELIDDKASYSARRVLSTATEVQLLSNLAFQSSAGDLLLFRDTSASDVQRYVVYNYVTGQTVKDIQNNDSSVTVQVSVDAVGDGETEAEFILIKKTTVSATDTTYSVELCDETGYKLADTAANISPGVFAINMLKFDGKVYRANSEGKLVYAFDYNGMGKAPVINEKVGEYYYGLSGGVYYVYDADLKLVAKYELPEYADSMASQAVLENGDLLIQYAYEADAMSDKYDFIESGYKYNYETVILRVKDGSAKEIDCDYVIGRVSNYDSEYIEENGLNSKIYRVVGTAYKVEDKRLSKMVGVYINKNGTVKELGELDGSGISDVEMVSDGRWLVYTDDGAEYLIDADGEIIGDISNASRLAGYILYDGKIYDYDLNMLYNYAAADLSSVDGTQGYIMLTDADGEHYLYTGGSDTQLVSSDSARVVTISDDYYVVRSGEYSNYTYTVYNSNGQQLLAKNTERTIVISTVYSTSEDGVLLMVETLDGTSYYAAK